MAKEILTFGGEKGGTGKSTAATNFACILARLGFSTLLINADEQKTATKFTQARSEDQPDAPQYGCVSLFDRAVRTEILKIRDNYDYIVIDTGGRDTTSQRAALSVSTIALCPFAPRDFDLETLDKVEAIVEEAQATNPNLKVYSFINQADPQGQ